MDESDTSNKYFPGEEVYHNLLKVDPEVGDTCDREGLEKFEVLERRMEDVTENKDGGVLKMVLEAGTGSVAPQGALVRGESYVVFYVLGPSLYPLSGGRGC